MSIFSAPKTPAAPNYAAAADAQGVANLNAARTTAKLGNVNQYTPFGNLIFNQLPGDRWQSRVTLPKDLQVTVNNEMANQRALSQIAKGQLGRISDTFGEKYDAPSSDDVVNALLERQKPQFDQNRQRLETQLYNSGAVPGSKQWENAMRDQITMENDARLAAIIRGDDVRGQRISQDLALRNLPLSEYNALMSGAQPTTPSFSAIGTSPGVQAPDLMGATQAQYNASMNNYNAQVGNRNSMMGGLFGLGTSVLSGGKPWWLS